MATPNDLIDLLKKPEVEAIQIEKPVHVKDGGWVAGVKRSGKWSWFYGPTPGAAVDRCLSSLKTLEVGHAPAE